MRSHQIVHVRAQAVKLEVFVTGKVLALCQGCGLAACILHGLWLQDC